MPELNGSALPGTGSIQARVIAELRQRIIKGVLEPGALLSELALADEFGVSRTPVREAFKQLQTEGLVKVRPRVGTFVVIDLIIQKDSDSAERVMREHVRASRRALFAGLET